jgi:hypothetical protein
VKLAIVHSGPEANCCVKAACLFEQPIERSPHQHIGVEHESSAAAKSGPILLQDPRAAIHQLLGSLSLYAATDNPRVRKAFDVFAVAIRKREANDVQFRVG